MEFLCEIVIASQRSIIYSKLDLNVVGVGIFVLIKGQIVFDTPNEFYNLLHLDAISPLQYRQEQLKMVRLSCGFYLVNYNWC